MEDSLVSRTGGGQTAAHQTGQENPGQAHLKEDRLHLLIRFGESPVLADAWHKHVEHLAG
ncbi:hypothetical protein D3C75_1065150 [compost metagenome]